MDAWDNAPGIVVVCGPTATGKTALALHLARELGGEVVGADSMQVYAGLVVGTAAPTAHETGDVPVHLTGTVSPGQPFSVADWLSRARDVIAGVLARGAAPIVCGGTGLYISGLLEGIDYAAGTHDAALQKQLYADWESLGSEAMLARLVQCDPERAKALNPNDQKRVLRALEQRLATGRTAARREADSRPERKPYAALLLGLDYCDRAELYGAVEARVDAMLAVGLLNEAKTVWKNRERYITAVQAIGYKEFFPYFEGTCPLEECVRRMKQATRNYAKRQITWFRHMEGVHWLQANDPELQQKALTLAREFMV